ncbi:MAG: hypothetical protein J3K34DRAFT_424459 [Monoraphidium minutum]|nr:MAG: hypothetical protein J3K34DRAFT_424459 [Monoraphidium minutum]
MTDTTRRAMTNAPDPAAPGGGPSGMNAFSHKRSLPPADDRVIVRPNFDTLYSSAWLDLSKGPVIVSSEDTGGRYFQLPILDMWTDVLGAPGSRTTGTKAGAWAVVPPGWAGTLPQGVGRVDATTNIVWVVGRTQANGPGDYASVHKVQDGFKITPLEQWGTPGAPRLPPYKADPTVDLKTEPMKQVNTMPASRFFPYAADLMEVHPPHKTDWSQVARLKRLGIKPGESFDWTTASPEVKAALDRATKAGLAAIVKKIPTIAPVKGGWQMNTETIGTYGNAYLKRAVIALVGLGANQAEDAVYPMALADSEGEAVAAPAKYEIRFAKDKMPPAGAFWSVTMYDGEGFQVANKLNRFALGDRDALHYDPDGSLTLYIQPDTPGDKQEEANWLPAPKEGPVSVTMRLYEPKASVLDGTWVPPPLKRVA